MGSQDQDRQDVEVERIIRRAEELGHDPERVARALDYAAPVVSHPGVPVREQ